MLTNSLGDEVTPKRPCRTGSGRSYATDDKEARQNRGWSMADGRTTAGLVVCVPSLEKGDRIMLPLPTAQNVSPFANLEHGSPSPTAVER